MKKALQKIDTVLASLESGFIVFFLMALVLAGVLQIILRRLTDFAVPDLEITMRWVVVWLTFIGASLATRERKHVSVDALGRLFKGKSKVLLNLVIDSFSLFIVILLLQTSWEFVMEEMEYGGTLMNEVPAWLVEIVLPFGFAIIALRLLLHIGQEIISLLKGPA